MMEERQFERKALMLAVLVALLTAVMIVLSGCKTKKESVIDFEVTHHTDYQERRQQQHDEWMSNNRTESHDTTTTEQTVSGEINIERDTAGRTVKIVYIERNNRTDRSTSRGSKVGNSVRTVVVGDTIVDEETDVAAEGSEKVIVKTGFQTWDVAVVIAGLCLLMIIIICYNKWRG